MRGVVRSRRRSRRFSLAELDLEISAGVDAFFANVAAKVKLEPTTRSELRQVFERKITGLIRIINDIAVAIQAKEKRLPLVLIDDLDKLDLKLAEEIFKARREIMLQPNCAIVYTISSALFYSKEFEAIRDRAFFLPNVKLHPHQEPKVQDEDGYKTMRWFVFRRMASDLATSASIEEAIDNSGGVFREMARIMRSTIGRARRRHAERIEVEDVAWAVTEIRNEYRRILDQQDQEYLAAVHQHNRLESHDWLGPMLQILALLEYRNAENWCDIHPALRPLVEDDDEQAESA